MLQESHARIYNRLRKYHKADEKGVMFDTITAVITNVLYKGSEDGHLEISSQVVLIRGLICDTNPSQKPARRRYGLPLLVFLSFNNI